MIALLLLLFVLVLLFGGLGLFVAKVFLIGIVITLIIGVVAGMATRRGT